MVKPLSFKGDKKTKKRKHKETFADPDVPQSDPSLEETWTTADLPSDLSGPIMLLLPSPQDTEPVCLASDQTGTVFPSTIENLIPETPVRLSAEPSDVRQVWVVNKVPGENAGWTLKSHQGRYLGADRVGVVSCDREAAGMEEVWHFVDASKMESTKGEDDEGASETVEDGVFYLKTSRKMFLSLSASTSARFTDQLVIRADSETPSTSTRLFIRMQSKFKPKLQASKELKAKEKISRKQLEEAVGRRLDEDEVRKLKKARRGGDWHEAVLDARVKGSHDKFA